MVWLWILIPFVLCVLLYGRLFLLYPKPERELEQLQPWSFAFVRAAGETLFPSGGEVPVSADDADVPGYMDRWFALLPKQQRGLLKLLYILLEQAPLASGFHIRRFSGLTAKKRSALLARWEKSRFYYKRMLVTSLRTVFSLAYLDHPDVHEALGIKDRKTCQPTKSTHLAPDNCGKGALLDLDDHGRDVTVEADVVVVGTGAGGAVAAKTLAEAGLDVVVLETGPFRRPEEVDRNCGMGMTQILYEAGLRTMFGPTATPTIQGRCVGGSTLPNSAILFRIPDYVLDEWRDEHGVEGISNEVLAPGYERVEKAARRQQARREQLGPKNLLFAKGAEAVGIDAEAFYLGKDGCKGCGECFPSCPIGAKYSTDLSHIPDAVKAGANLYVNCQCDKVTSSRGAVTGVKGTFTDSKGGKAGSIVVRSRAVVLAGGVFGTPPILKKSRIANSSGMVGRNLHAHPGAAIFGLFDEEVNPWIGSTQGYGAFIDRVLKIEVLWSPLALMAVRMPGFGHVLQEHLAKFKNIAVWDAVVRGTSTGRILFGSGNNPSVWFNLNQRDTDVGVRGLRIVADMFFAAGAKSLLPGIYGLPTEMGPKDVHLLEPGKLKPSQVTFAATHLFGTCRMGSDPKTSVVSSMGESHDVRNLYICDGSVMPNGTGVNPHEPIMALADYFSHGIIERLKHS